MVSRSVFLLRFYILWGVVLFARAELGDYADLSYQCPATITCRPICAAALDDCPIDLVCQNDTTLCADGSCAAKCVDTLSSLCADNTCGKNVTCVRAILPEPECLLAYEAWYTNATEGEMCEDVVVELLSFTDAGFLAFYGYFAVVLFLIVAYPAFNQRFFPEGNTVPLLDFSKESEISGIPVDDKGWTQTSVRTTWIGTLIYYLTTLTLWGFQCLLLVLIVFYYRQQRGEFKPVSLNPFQDEIQVLKAFEVVWIVGILFSLCLKWPPTIESLFLRRCVSAQASYVAVFAPSTVPELKSKASNTCAIIIQKGMGSVSKIFTTVLSFIFSDVSRRKDVRGSVQYCPITVDTDGTRSFFFRLRRYVYDDDAGCYIPGVFDIGSKLCDFQKCVAGLSESDATLRRSRIGTNSIDLKKPNFIFGVMEEFNKPFYIYQNFITWVRCPVMFCDADGHVILTFYMHHDLIFVTCSLS